MEAGLYIHIPFCKKRCNYCDFYTQGGCGEVPEGYVDAVVNQLKKYPQYTFSTVYFGGGTPSLLQPAQVKQILQQVHLLPDAEITLEANPETLTLKKLQEYYQNGINRLSIGVQTAHDHSLQVLGRIHTSDKVRQVFQWAHQAGFVNISADLMLGLDNYTYQELDDTITLIERCGATHISAYMLKVEEGTPFYIHRPKNLSSEEQLADFYLYTCSRLEKLGYHQYEISNFCKDGFYSRHNTIYWQLGNYLGIGPSAHSCLNGKRFFYPADTAGFIAGAQPVLDGEVDKDDFIMLSLRLKKGLDLTILQKDWGITLSDVCKKQLILYEKEGYLVQHNHCISLTPKGFLVENAIACLLMQQ